LSSLIEFFLLFTLPTNIIFFKCGADGAEVERKIREEPK
jgi:hypothetical protein